ncbi:MAG: aldehyde dehydrogenase family protein [Bacteroidetes bacterium]|nr:aldehyde dehydrogenase family protein [Bacteroidota bacterium]
MDIIPEKEIINLVAQQKAEAFRLRTSPISDRKKKLRKLRNWILDHADLIRKAVHDDFSKPYAETDACEIFPILSEINLVLSRLDDWSRPRKVDTPLTLLGSKGEVRYEPRGVCLIMAPWNYPFNLCIGPLIPCLAAGNTAVIKPSEITPATSAIVRQLVSEIFEPREVAVFEGGPGVAQFLLKQPFDHFFFTGSASVGKLVMQAAADQLASVTLELGGKSPAIVHSDASIKDAAKRIAFGKFLNNGQTCIAPDFVMVHKSVRSEFLNRLKEEVLNMFGNGSTVSEQSDAYGKISSDRHFIKLRGLLDDSLQKGWQLLLSGPIIPEKRFFHPTIITGSWNTSKILEEEIFGPILPIMEYEDLDNVIAEIHKMPRALALYVFSESSKIKNYLSDRIPTGTVCFNDCLIQFVHNNLPFGGVNQSGFGLSHGEHGFRSFSHERAVVSQRSGLSTPYVFHPPYKSWLKPLMKILFRWF